MMKVVIISMVSITLLASQAFAGIADTFSKCGLSINATQDILSDDTNTKEYISEQVGLLMTFCLGSVIGNQCSEEAVSVFSVTQNEVSKLLNEKGFDGEALTVNLQGLQYCPSVLADFQAWSKKSSKSDSED